MNKRLIIYTVAAALLMCVTAKAQINVLGSVVKNKVLIGCFNGSTGNFAYSPQKIDRLMEMVIQNGSHVTNSQLMNQNGAFYIQATATNPLGKHSTIAVILEKDGNLLQLASGGCTHTCTPTDNCSCKITISIPCQEISCDCNSGSGGCSSTITTNVSFEVGPINKLLDFLDPQRFNKCL